MPSLSIEDPFLGGGAPGRLAGPGSSLATKIGTSPKNFRAGLAWICGFAVSKCVLRSFPNLLRLLACDEPNRLLN